MNRSIKINDRRKRASLGFGLLIALSSSNLMAVPHRVPESISQESPMPDLRIKSGKLLAKGQNATPSGPLKLLSYKLEEVNLPQPVELEIRGRKELAQSALRLTITSGANLHAHLIWIDDASIRGVWGAGEEGVAAFITDRSILRDGAVISVSHNGTLYELPERLKLPQSIKANLKPAAVEAGNTTNIRSALRITGAVRQPLIEIEFQTGRKFLIMNSDYTAQSGKRFFRNLFVDYAAGRAVLSLTPEEFAQLKDGDLMAVSVVGVVNYGAGGGPGVWLYGRLDKSLLK